VSVFVRFLPGRPTCGFGRAGAVLAADRGNCSLGSLRESDDDAALAARGLPTFGERIARCYSIP
jgi:hypothetical protein